MPKFVTKALRPEMPVGAQVKGTIKLYHQTGIFEQKFAEYDKATALNASGAADIIERCPEYVWENSPFNPQFEAKRSRGLDLGQAAHFYMLQPKLFRDNVVPIDAVDYRTNAAKEQRDNAYARGKTPILDPEMDIIAGMKGAFERHPIARHAFANPDGVFERSLFWFDQRAIPCKARPDFLAGDHSYIADIKTTSNASPGFIKQQIYRMNNHQRVAWYLDGVEAVGKRRPAHYWFISIEKKPPYLISVWELPEKAIEAGNIENTKAKDLFAKCLESDRWHGYRPLDAPDKDAAFVIDMHPGAYYEISDRHELGWFKTDEAISPALMRVAQQYQSPNEEGEE